MPSRTKKKVDGEQWTVDGEKKIEASPLESASDVDKSTSETKSSAGKSTAAKSTATKSTRTRRKTTRKKSSASSPKDADASPQAAANSEPSLSKEESAPPVDPAKSTRTRRKTTRKKTRDQDPGLEDPQGEASTDAKPSTAEEAPAQTKTTRPRRKTTRKKSAEQEPSATDANKETSPDDASPSAAVEPAISKTTRTRRKTARKKSTDQKSESEAKHETERAIPEQTDAFSAAKIIAPKQETLSEHTPAQTEPVSDQQKSASQPAEPQQESTTQLESSEANEEISRSVVAQPQTTTRKRRSRGGRGRSRRKAHSDSIDAKPTELPPPSAVQDDVADKVEKSEALAVDVHVETAPTPPSVEPAPPLEKEISGEESAPKEREDDDGSTLPPPKRKRRSRGGRGRGRKRRNGVPSGVQDVSQPEETAASPPEANIPSEQPAPDEPLSTPEAEKAPEDKKAPEVKKAATTEDRPAEETPTRKRRRSRGGRGRGRNRERERATEEPQVAAQQQTAPETQQVAEPEALVEMPPHRRMIFSQEAGYEIAAIASDGRLTDFWIQEEKRADQGAAGNIYRGVVSRVIPALNAAFVDIGLGKEGFLPYSDLGPEIYRQRQDGKKSDFRSIEGVLSKGDVIMVQLAKEAIGDKGPALSTKISFPGRFLVYMPYVKVMRMSRQLDEGEKKKLSSIFERQKDLEGGVIFRTAAKGQSDAEIQNDFNYLKKIWAQVQKDFQSGDGPKLLHKELDLFERVLRDHFSGDISEVVIYHQRIKGRVERFFKKIHPSLPPDEIIAVNADRLNSVWKTYNLEKDIDQLFSNIVSLDCGGYMIIEEMETLTAIDINSGGNILRKNLDETIYQTNLEAAVEVTRQMRLRQLGGIIIIDFIDMAHKRHQEQVFRTLERELEKDRTPSDLQHFTELGLIQITRQRTGRSLTKRLTFNCPHCHGSGRLPSLQLTDKRK